MSQSGKPARRRVYTRTPKPLNDTDLKGRLNQEVVNLRALQVEMFSRSHHPEHDKDCQCRGSSLCAFHAEIFNNIGEAISRLSNAAKAIDKG